MTQGLDSYGYVFEVTKLRPEFDLLETDLKLMSSKRFAIVGSIVHSLTFGSLEIIANGAIVCDNGLISDVIDLDKRLNGLEGILNVIDHKGKLIIPGLIDAHCHAPQYVFSGTGMDLPLLDWLNKYTFPTGKLNCLTLWL